MLKNNGDVLKGRLGCGKERREALNNNVKVLKNDVDACFEHAQKPNG